MGYFYPFITYFNIQKQFSAIILATVLATFPNIGRIFFILLVTLVGWHASDVSLPPGDDILAQLACPLNDVIFVYNWNN